MSLALESVETYDQAAGALGVQWTLRAARASCDRHQQQQCKWVSHGRLQEGIGTILAATAVPAQRSRSVAFGGDCHASRSLFSIVTIVVLLMFGGLTFLEAPRLQANLPTPWIGLFERINISVFLLWVVVLAAVLWRNGTSQEETPQVSPTVHDARS